MVLTRASRKRASGNESSSNKQQGENHRDVIDLIGNDLEEEPTQPKSKRQRKALDDNHAPSKRDSNNHRGRVLQSVNPNDKRIKVSVAANSACATTRNTIKPQQQVARVVSENPPTKHTKVTTLATSACGNNNRSSMDTCLSKKSKGVPIKTPATESSTASDNDVTNNSRHLADGTATCSCHNAHEVIGGNTVSQDGGPDSSSQLLSGNPHHTRSHSHDSAPDDIDACDRDDPQSVSQYVKEIYEYYRVREEETRVRTPLTIATQPNITERMRAILVDWILEVHYKFKLHSHTLYLTVSILDHYLCHSETPVTRRNLQLVGVTSLLVAAKYEELFVPELRDLVYICDGAYVEAEVMMNMNE